MKKIKKYHRGAHTYIKWDKLTTQVIKDKKKKETKTEVIADDGVLPVTSDRFIIHFNPDEFVIDFCKEYEVGLNRNISSTSDLNIKAFKVQRRVILSPSNVKKLYGIFGKFGSKI